MVRPLLAALAGLLIALCSLPVGAADRPTIMFFPFSAPASAPPDLGNQLAGRVAAEIASIGGITVMHGDPAATIGNFRALARAAGADGYVTGSIVSVGANNYIALEQLVSARTGILMWTNTITFRSLDDVAGTGRALHDVLLNVQAAPSTAGTLPVEPTATPVAASGIDVLPVQGPASRSDRAFATTAIVEAVQKLGFTATAIPQRATDWDKIGPGLCVTTHAQLVIATQLTTQRQPPPSGGPPQTTAFVAISAYDCVANALDPNPIVADSAAQVSTDAIRDAIHQALVLMPSLPPEPNP
jgi:hypothetical protein